MPKQQNRRAKADDKEQSRAFIEKAREIGADGRAAVSAEVYQGAAVPERYARRFQTLEQVPQ